MNKYNRYFRITEGALMDAINNVLQVNNKAKEQYQELIKELGAKNEYWHVDNRLTALIFDEEPDLNLFKKADNGWYPRKNTKEGRALAKRFEEIQTLDEDSILPVANLPKYGWCLSYGGKIFKAHVRALIPSDPKVLIIGVPWYDEDPEELAQYIKDREEGKRGNMNLDHLCWKPTPEMVEVKEWQVGKEIDEWNSALKEDAA